MNRSTELLYVTAHYLPRGQAQPIGAFHWNEKQRNVFWASGDTIFDNPEPFVKKHQKIGLVLPTVNLYRFKCYPSSHNFSNQSVLQIEIEDRWATDSIAHDLDIFKAAYHRNKDVSDSLVAVLFTLAYEICEFHRETEWGSDSDIECTCLGELDFKRIAEICIKPDSPRPQGEGQGVRAS